MQATLSAAGTSGSSIKAVLQLYHWAATLLCGQTVQCSCSKKLENEYESRTKMNEGAVVPPEVLLLIGVHFARQSCLKARLVCLHWNRLVSRFADPHDWCNRLWLRGNGALNWPDDDRFPLFLPPSFLDLVTLNKVICFTWEQLAPLARHMLSSKVNRGFERRERQVWQSICERYSNAVSEADLGRIVTGQVALGTFGLDTLLQSEPFRIELTEWLKWNPTVMQGQGACLKLLRSGVWYSLLDEPPLERQRQEEGDVVEMDVVFSPMLQAWNEFVFTNSIYESSVLAAILTVNDAELVQRVEALYGGEARYEEAKRLAVVQLTVQ